MIVSRRPGRPRRTWRPSIEGKPNVPLAQSENENARKLVTLDEELTIDLDDLSAAGERLRPPPPLPPF